MFLDRFEITALVTIVITIFSIKIRVLDYYTKEPNCNGIKLLKLQFAVTLAAKIHRVHVRRYEIKLRIRRAKEKKNKKKGR